jgi:hypothetical protein
VYRIRARVKLRKFRLFSSLSREEFRLRGNSLPTNAQCGNNRSSEQATSFLKISNRRPKSSARACALLVCETDAK